MKKTILLTALLASASAFAGTHGTVGTSVEFKTDYTKKGALTNEFKGTKVTPKVEAEVAVDGTGFSFGGEYYLKELQPLNSGSLTLGTIESASKGHIFMKYELPEIKGVKSYVKGTFNDKKELTGEFDAKYDYKGYTIGFNSTTTSPLFSKDNAYTETAVKIEGNTVEDYVKAEKDKVKLTASEKAYVTAFAIAKEENKDKTGEELKTAVDEEIAKAKENKKEYVAAGIKEDIINDYTTVETPFSKTESTHTLSVETKKIGQFEDAKLSAAVTHAWGNTYHLKQVDGNNTEKPINLDEDVTAPNKLEKVSNNDAFKSFEVKGELSYRKIKNLDLKGEFDITYNHNGSGLNGKFLGYDVISEKLHMDKMSAILTDTSNENMFTLKTHRNVTDKFALTGVYTGIDKLKATAKLFVNHLGEVKYNNGEKLNFVEYGIDAKAEYKAMENLTLTGNAVFAGQAAIIKYEKEQEESNGKKYSRKAKNFGYVKLAAGAKYDYKVNDKLTVTPEVNGMFESAFIHNEKIGDKSKLVALNTVAITPKVAVDYKISDTLSLNGALESKFVFDNLNLEGKIKYDHTTVKSSLGLKYTW